METVLTQLGRPTDLGELHELAYADGRPWSPVAAPAEAWRRLFEEFARSVQGVVEERAAEVAERWSWISDAERCAAVARVRLWAGLPPIAAPLELDALGGEPKAAAGSLAAAAGPSTDALAELFGAYRSARDKADQSELSFSDRLDISRRARELAGPLCDLSAKAAEPLMHWLLEEVGIRSPWCDHIVWSDYSAQHPRTLHLFPDGHLFLEEGPITRAMENSFTACGLQIHLSWRVDRSWTRATPGEWLEHYHALVGYREKVEAHEAAGERLPYRAFDPDYQEARRICLKCAAYHGQSIECLDPGDETRRWPPWRFAEIRERTLSRALDRLGDGARIDSLESARRIVMEAWLDAEIAITATELKARGPGPLRRLFGDRQGRTPSLYQRWGETCEPFALEPHELLGRSLWERVLTESLGLFDQHDVSPADRGRVRDGIQRVVEARVAGLR